MTATTSAPPWQRERIFPAKITALGTKADGDGALGPEGSFEALVSVFGNVDSYGDRMMPGAFTNTLAEWQASGDPLPVLWAHRWDDPFCHLGSVTDAEETDRGLVVRGQLDLDTPLAQQVYRLLKSRRVTDFSFAFDYLDVEAAEDEKGKPELDDWGWPIYNINAVKLYEVGPCLVGANPDTDLLGLKGKARAKKAIASHSTATDDAAWDAGANETNLSNDDGAEVYRNAYAWVDPAGDADTKSAYKFIHHFVSASGTPGAASTRACSASVAVLNGGRGGADIPDADRQGVWNHVARHLRDADMEPPELRARRARRGAAPRPGRAIKVAAHSAVQLREGRVLSKATVDRITNALGLIDASADAIDSAVDDLYDLLDEANPEDETEPGATEPAQPATETDGKVGGREATRGPAAWMTAFENVVAGMHEGQAHDDRRGDRPDNG